MMKYIIGLCLAFVASIAIAQEAPPITFGASVTSGNGELSTTLTWDATGYTTCEGSGHEAWNGPKLVAGSEVLPTISMSGSYTLVLTCRIPGDTTANLSWIAPTTNTDGTALTNLAGYRINYGNSPTVLQLSQQIPNPSVTSHTFNGLAVGTWYFGVKAYTSTGVESAISNVVSKVISNGTERLSSVSLTVNPIPSAPSGVTVE
jgi:hypothetical protein